MVHLVISSDKSNIEFDMDSSKSICDVKQAIHDQCGYEIFSQVILKDNEEIPSSRVLESFGVEDPLKLTLRLETKAAEFIQPSEIERTIVVTDIPMGEQRHSEDELIKAFSVFGDISRLILQRDTDSSQHAVIVYSTIEAAQTSIHYNGTILDGKVNVVSANQLPNDGKSQDANSGMEKLKRFLAKGVLLGQRGVDSVREFDDRHHISEKFKAGADLAMVKAKEMDDQFKLSEKVKLAGDKVHEFDTKHGISKSAANVVACAAEKSKGVSDKAMQNESVAKGVQKVSSMFSSLKTMSSQGFDDVKNRVHQLQSEEHNRSSKDS